MTSQRIPDEQACQDHDVRYMNTLALVRQQAAAVVRLVSSNIEVGTDASQVDRLKEDIRRINRLIHESIEGHADKDSPEDTDPTDSTPACFTLLVSNPADDAFLGSWKIDDLAALMELAGHFEHQGYETRILATPA